MTNKTFGFAVLSLFLFGCQQDNNSNETEPAPSPIVPTEKQILSAELTDTINEASQGEGKSAFALPKSDDYANIPQEPNNPITEEKVSLGKLLFHETGLSTKGVNEALEGTWSCASCHHADAGFKSGIAQGIGEGGSGFAQKGAMRKLMPGFDMDSAQAHSKT